MSAGMGDMFYVVIISAGLVIFTYLLFVSKNKKRNVQNRRDRIKRNWSERL